MRRPSAAVMLACIAAACTRQDLPQPAAQTLAEAKSAIAERDRRLTSFRLEGIIREAGQEAPFEAAFRAPNRVRGVLRGSAGRTVSFDGARLYEIDPAKKTVVTYQPEDGASAAVTQLLSAFVPEGYRVPVLPLGSARARRLPHPRGPEIVELSSEARDEQGEAIRVTYLLRWPSMDLVEKRLSAYGKAKTLVVDEEQCDARLKVCVPRQLTERLDGATGAVTTLSRIELNAPVAADEFTVFPPEGYAGRTEALPASR
jgi:outer membrane lipoprotein-sorting protein